MNFNLKQLEAFVWIADLGSFRKAADRLHTTQPNISARLSGLETALNVTLMKRDGGTVRLTSKGKELLGHARRILEAAQELSDAADHKPDVNGTLRLGVTELIAHSWLRPYLKRLKDQFPNLVVELTVDLSVNLSLELFSRSIDLALQNGPFEQEADGQLELETYDWIWVAAPSLGIDKDRCHTANDLLQYPVLTHARDTIPHKQLATFFSSSTSVAARLVPSSNLATCLHMVLDGMGIATLPRVMASREIEAGELVTIRSDWTPEPMPFFARYDRRSSPKFVERAASIASEVAKDQLIHRNPLSP